MPNAAPHLWAGRDDEARHRDQSLSTCRDERLMDFMCTVIAAAHAIYFSSRAAVNVFRPVSCDRSAGLVVAAPKHRPDRPAARGRSAVGCSGFAESVEAECPYSAGGRGLLFRNSRRLSGSAAPAAILAS